MSKENLKKNFLVQGSILAAASIVVRFIGLIYRIPMTRILGDTAMGYYSYAFEIYNLALILSSYSIPLSVSKLVAARVGKEEYYNSHKVFKTTLVFSSIIGFFATIIVYLLSDAYSLLIKNPNVAIPLRVLAPTIFVFSVMGVIRGYFQGFNNMIPTAISQVIEQIVNAVVSIVASYFMLKYFSYKTNAEAYGAAGGTLGTLSGAIASLVVLVIIYFIYRPLIKQRITGENISFKESTSSILKVLIATALPVIISQTIYQISGTVDSVFYNRIMASKGFNDETRSSLWSVYSNKYRTISNVPVAVASAMGTAVVPSLITEYSKGRIENMKKKISSVVKFNMIIAFPCAAGLSFFARPIMILLFGDGSDVTANVMRLGGICVVFFALSTVTNGILQGINRMKLPVIHSAFSLFIHIPLLCILLYYTDLNVYALVICNIIFPLIVCILNWISIGKLINYRQEVLKTFIIPFISSILMGIIGIIVYRFIAFLGNSISTIISIMVCIPVYFIFLIKLKGVTENELRDMPKGILLIRFFKKFHIL